MVSQSSNLQKPKLFFNVFFYSKMKNPNSNEKYEKDEWEVRPVLFFPLFFAAKQLLLSTNLSIFSHKTKEDEEASSLRLTMDHGLHHGPSMMAAVSKFSDSSFPPWA